MQHAEIELANTDAHPCGFVIHETLYWPRHACGFAGAGRGRPDAWIDDLIRHGLRIAHTADFIVEDVLDRFTLCIHQDGSYRTDPVRVAPWPGATFVTDEGDSADSLDDLIATCTAQAPDWLYPLEYQCRVVRVRDPERYKLIYLGAKPEFERVGDDPWAKPQG